MAGAPALAMLVLGLWRVDRGGMWRDEAVTFQVARRTLPQIWRLLHGVDAVHGLYYLLMHFVLAVRADEVVLRLPSVAGAAVTAGLVARVGARLARPRAGLWAGLLYAVNPMAGHYAQEGRSYALVAAGAMGATLLLLRGVEKGSWWGYGLVLGVTCWLHEFAVLLVLAHGVTLALARVGARVWRGWGCAAVAAGAALVPMVLVSRAQAAQVAWLRRPTIETAEGLLRSFFGVSPGAYWVCLGLAVVGAAGVSGGRGKVTLAGVALPLTLVGPGVLMLVSLSSPPLYVDRYVLYALAGAPLAVAAGAERVVALPARIGRPGGRVRPRPPSVAVTLLGLLAVALVLHQQFPVLRQDRDPARRPDDLASVARAAARGVRAGDAVLYLPGSARNTALAYPGAFRGTRDLALAEPGAGSGTLYGVEAPVGQVRRRLAGVARVWVVADRAVLTGRRTPRSPVVRTELAVLRQEFRVAGEAVRGRDAVRLYVRPVSPRSGPVPSPPRPARW
ncbi:glycosyltransferase family 39 protein [Streptomyces misionensis]|uniref:glycosyltransferase family 39 protein n=1 Tax=Streptomyces misionensis TaxID=67331 RepID=UPI003439CD1E